MKKTEKITTFVIWLIVVILIIAYVKYLQELKTIGKIVVSILPVLIFFTGGLLIFSRDHKKIKRAKRKKELTKTIELQWGQALKHDILTYLVPILILILPPLSGQAPDLITIFQACTAFLALTYLKFIYWGEL